MQRREVGEVAQQSRLDARVGGGREHVVGRVERRAGESFLLVEGHRPK